MSEMSAEDIAAGWRPLSEYTAADNYVVGRVFGFRARVHHEDVIRRGASMWWTPSGNTYGDPSGWKPLPPGVTGSQYEKILWRCGRPEPEPFVPPPEPVYEPGGTDVILTPVPLVLLLALHAGARLTEKRWRWPNYTLAAPGQEPQKIRERAVGGLTKHVFIQRDRPLPPGYLTHFNDFEWLVTEHGRAWLAANIKQAA